MISVAQVLEKRSVLIETLVKTQGVICCTVAECLSAETVDIAVFHPTDKTLHKKSLFL